MSLTLADVHRIAHLARIKITDEQARATAAQLNDIFAMIEQIGRVDTTGVAPMMHPLDGTQRLNIRRAAGKQCGGGGKDDEHGAAFHDGGIVA